MTTMNGRPGSTDAVLMDPTLVCSSFPGSSQSAIERSNMLDVIDDILDGHVQVVIAYGVEGSGRTTLLAQYAKRHSENAVCLFLSGTSRWGCDADIARADFANQIEWILNKRELPSDTCIDAALLRKLLIELTRRAKRRSEVYYFIIDGLFENAKWKSEIRQLIMTELPLVSTSRCKFIFSQTPECPLDAELAQLRHEVLRIPRFTEEESFRYLSDLNLSVEQARELHNICTGMPGYLSTAKRILQSKPQMDLFSNLPATLTELFELEWKCVSGADDRTYRYLALLAFGRSQYAPTEIADILQEELSFLTQINEKCTFLIIDHKNNKICFASENVRAFVENKLKGYRKEIYDLIIDNLLRNVDSERSMSTLPDYLDLAGRYDELLDYLSPQFFTAMLSRSQSIYAIQQKAEIGINAALKQHRDRDLMRLTLQKAAIAQLGGAEIWHSEVEARGATNDYDSAVKLAHSAIAREDKLQLFARIARLKRQQNLYPEAELLEHIKGLYNQIDPVSLGQRVSAIASDLLYVNPDMAIELLERAMRTDTSGNSTDWALAKLSLLAYRTSPQQTNLSTDTPGDKQDADVSGAIRSRIKNPSVREFSNAAAVLFAKYSASEIISQVGRLEKVSEQVLLLRLWVTQNKINQESAAVIDHALDLILRKSAELSPNAQLYRELASPLPHVSDHAKLRDLIAAFDAHKVSIERLGPSEEYVRLQLHIARGEARIDEQAAASRLEGIYVYSADIDDLSSKAGCLAWLWGALAVIDPVESFERSSQLHSSVQRELQATIDSILKESAEQYMATRSVIRALARTRPSASVAFALQLNTLVRRDLALLDFLEEFIRQKPAQLDASTIFSTVRLMGKGWLRNNAVAMIAEYLAQNSPLAPDTVISYLPLLALIEEMDLLSEKCDAYSHFYLAIGGESTAHSAQRDHIIERLTSSWQCIDVGWKKVDIGFKISSTLAKSGVTRARAFLTSTEDLRVDLTLDSDAAAESYVGCVLLAIRAFSGLLPRNLDTDIDVDRIASLIDRIPSLGQRATLWGELAIRYWRASRESKLRQCVTERIVPLLADIGQEGASYFATILQAVAPALYYSHRETAFEHIARLPAHLQDSCFTQIVYSILRKLSASDPYELIPGQLYQLSYSDILDICALLERIKEDVSVYYFIHVVTDTVAAKRNRDKYTLSQRINVADRFSAISQQKFPAPGGIQHDGYKLCAQAQIMRIRGNRNTAQWEELIKAGRSVLNTADRVFVLGTIAAAMRFDNRTEELAAKLFRDVKSLIDSIPIEFDRRERYEYLATLVADHDRVLWRECVQQAVQTRPPTQDPAELLRVQKRTVDLVYNLDPNYAASLISLIDDDPARQSEKAVMRTHLDMLDFKKRMLESLGETQAAADRKLISDGETYAEAAWRNLASLNADRITTIHFDHTREFIRVAGNFPIAQSYPILAWIIENAVRRLARTESAISHIRPIFEATLLATELAERMAVRSARQQRRIAALPTGQSPTTSSYLIRPGERERALVLLREWCEQNVRDGLVICDPFFGPDDLEILQILKGVAPQCSVEILTSTKHHNNERIAKPWDETYRANWRRISSQDPPDTKVVVIGLKSSGDHPMHDRWWLTDDAGLRMGTSLNSLGINKESEISFLSREEVSHILSDVNGFLRQHRREFKGERLDYLSFTL